MIVRGSTPGKHSSFEVVRFPHPRGSTRVAGRAQRAQYAPLPERTAGIVRHSSCRSKLSDCC
jgi:hypothetical protein